MKTGTANGWQIAFLSFAVLLMVVPLGSYVAGLAPGTAEQQRLQRALPFVIMAAMLALFPRLRRWYRKELSFSIPPEKRSEVAIVALGKVLFLTMGVAGAIALWHWLFGGPAALARHISMPLGREDERASVTSPLGTLQFLLLFSFIVPVLEELVFRGLLFRAWERQWGWFPAMIATSTMFALYHPIFLSAFMSSIVFVCLLRRTGTLWAPIIVHALGNLSLWYPLMGQFLFPAAKGADIAAWSLQIGCAVVVAIALPLYVWLARKPYAPGEAGAT